MTKHYANRSSNLYGKYEPDYARNPIAYQQESSYARGGLLDGIFGISKAAEDAANAVITKMGDALKESAREAGREEASRAADEIEKTILNSVNKTVENTAKIARDAAEKAVKNVGPEVANLLKPEVNFQIEKSVKEFCAKKIENLVKPEIENKVSEFITEARMEKEVNSILQSVRAKALHDLGDHIKEMDGYFNRIKFDVSNQRQVLNDSVEKFKCELAATKSYILKAGAQSFHESAESLNSMADQATCGGHQDPMYF